MALWIPRKRVREADHPVWLTLYGLKSVIGEGKGGEGRGQNATLDQDV